MKFALQFLVILLIAFAIYSLWFGIGMLAGVGVLVFAATVQIMVLCMQVEESATAIVDAMQARDNDTP